MKLGTSLLGRKANWAEVFRTDPQFTKERRDAWRREESSVPTDEQNLETFLERKCRPFMSTFVPGAVVTSIRIAMSAELSTPQ